MNKSVLTFVLVVAVIALLGGFVGGVGFPRFPGRFA